jgi:hypothetical protein
MLRSWQARSACTWVWVAALLLKRSLFAVPRPSSVSRPLPRTHMSRYGRLRHIRLCRKVRLLTDGASQSMIASRDAVTHLASKRPNMGGSSLELDAFNLHRRGCCLGARFQPGARSPALATRAPGSLGCKCAWGGCSCNLRAAKTLRYTSTRTSMATHTRGWVGASYAHQLHPRALAAHLDKCTLFGPGSGSHLQPSKGAWLMHCHPLCARRCSLCAHT